MARFQEINDFYYSTAGDFMLGEDGDLGDTRLDHYRGFIQKIETRLSSSKGDWALQGGVGANLTAVVGKQNTAETGAQLKNSITTSLVEEGLLRAGEFTVDVFPVSKYMIAAVLFVTPPRVGGQLMLTFTYDLRRNKIIPRNF